MLRGLGAMWGGKSILVSFLHVGSETVCISVYEYMNLRCLPALRKRFSRQIVKQHDTNI